MEIILTIVALLDLLQFNIASLGTSVSSFNQGGELPLHPPKVPLCFLLCILYNIYNIQGQMDVLVEIAHQLAFAEERKNYEVFYFSSISIFLVFFFWPCPFSLLDYSMLINVFSAIGTRFIRFLGPFATLCRIIHL